MVPGSKAHPGTSKGIGIRVAFAVATVLFGLVGPSGETRRAKASGDTRTLTFFHTHTKESATITFWRDGGFDHDGLGQLNWFLRDWRVNEPARMDPHLFNVLWEVYREAGSREPINIISAYRSPKTNAMLRHRSKGVSEQSQHMRGKAMDIRLPDVDTARLRAIAMRMQYGGVGFYPSSAFVHVDTGSVRAWPRMSQDQLVRLFPDGKTVHLPSNGKPLARYEEAKAEIQARNQALASAAGTSSRLPGLLASLFRREPKQSDDAEPPAAMTTASLPSAQRIEAKADPFVPLPPRRPVRETAVLLSAAASPEPMSGTRAKSIDGPTRDFLTEPSRLLFSSARIREQLPSHHHRVEGFAPRLLLHEYLTADGRPRLAQTFSGRLDDLAGGQGFTGPAVAPVPIWRVAYAQP